MKPDWARALFEAFATWPNLPRNRNAVARRMNVYAGFFSTIGAGCDGPHDINQARLLALFGNEGLRRLLLPVRFLAEHLELTFNPITADAVAENRRIAAMLTASADQPWAIDLRDFHASLTLDDLTPKTIRIYLSVASGLMVSAGLDRAGYLNQRHVTAHLRRRPGHRASLASFLSWLAVHGGQNLSVGKKRQRNPRRYERAVLQASSHLLDSLDRARNIRQGRAALAQAIAHIHNVPLTRVLALSYKEVEHAANGGVTLWPETLDVVLAAELANNLRQYGSTGPLLFPGRNGVQPLSTAAIDHHTGRKSRVGRNTRTVVRSDSIKN